MFLVSELVLVWRWVGLAICNNDTPGLFGKESEALDGIDLSMK